MGSRNKNKNKGRAHDIFSKTGSQLASPPAKSLIATSGRSSTGAAVETPPASDAPVSAAPRAESPGDTVPAMVEQAERLAAEGDTASQASHTLAGTAQDLSLPPTAEEGKVSAPPPVPDSETLRGAIRQAADAKQTFQAAEARAKAREDAAEATAQSLRGEQARLEGREQALREWHEKLAAREKGMEHARIALDQRELEAKAGFPELLASARESLEHSTQCREQEVAALREKALSEMQSAKQQLMDAANERAAAKRAQDDLVLDREQLEERIALAAKRAERSLQLRLDSLQQELEDAKRREQSVHERLIRREAEVRELEKRLAPSGSQSIEQLAAKRDELQSQLKERDAELKNRPDADSVAELRRQAAAVEGLRREVEQAKGDNAALRSRLAGLSIAATELENQRDLVKALEGRARLLKEANVQLEADVASKLEQNAGRNPFAELGRMDQDADLQRKFTGLRKPDSLKALVQELRERIASGPHPLYYDETTLRCFLAGMAMSRLHLLQGISGTGKTSLPRAVGRALGGDVEIVPVQAGWRDRQDLLGYFNAFDKRYHEPPFVQALYRAQCPKWDDRVCIIVLDEMNLSYFEQYGADLNSEIEQPPPHERRFQLVDSRPPLGPRLLRDGRYLAWPDNVWVAGTANHDETTKDFADKTYDRAHTMELLPARPQPMAKVSSTGGPPVSYSGLRELFDTAARSHSAAATQANVVLGKLKGQLQQNLRVGWGNRLDGPGGQLARYVSVVAAAGGSSDEALDHILATKLLRKLRGKHEVRLKSLEQFRDSLLTTWRESFGATCQPTKSQELLSELLQARRFEETESA